MLLATVTACSERAYGPNFQHNPQFEEAGDWQISGSYGRAPQARSIDLSVAHAVDANFGVMLNAQYAYDDITLPDRQGYYLEPAVGLYRGNHKLFNYSLYATYGIGRQTIEITGKDIFEMYWRRYALQPAVQFDLDGFYLGFSARIGMISFDPGFSNYLREAYLGPNQMPFRIASEFLLFEPAVTLSYPWYIFLISFQYIHQFPYYQHGAFARNYVGGSIALRIPTK